MSKVRIFCILFFATGITGFGQSIPIYTQYIVNPYIYNPAYAGLEGKPTVGLTYRKQWYGITDAPTTTNFVFHAPVIAGLNMGLNVTQDNYGIFKSSSALLSFGYTVSLGWNHYLSLGISGGAGFNNIDYTNVDLSDPAFANVVQQSTYLDGNAGVAYHVGNFNLGIALPRIFDTETFPTQTFDTGTLGLIKNYIITADYMVYFADDNFAFQPYGLYRSYDSLSTQFEAGGIFHIKNMLWVGGAYRQDFGIAGLAGVKIKGMFSFGYAYEIPSVKANNINKTSHEIQLNLSFGKKNKRSKKHATFLASNKPEKEKKEKKKDEVVAKKEEPNDEIVEKKVETTAPTDTEVIKAPAIVVAPIIKDDVKNDSQKDPDPFTTTTTPTIEVSPIKKETPSYTEDNKPAIVAKKGNHPFELEKGHYVVVGAFGVFENAVRYSDKAQAQGYNTEYGFNTEKNLFYVVIKYANNPEKTRQMRNELRKTSQFAKAWYLLVE
jgi:type IX secretion system PorP/SprF family membrane protein